MVLNPTLSDAIPPDASKKTDADPFKFDPQVLREAWTRQNGRCGFCGEDLMTIMRGEGFDESNDRVEAHHIVSRQSAKLGASPDVLVFLRSTDNCIYLCGDCHLRRAHGHNFNNGGLRPPEDFQYSHGGLNTAERSEWIARAKAQWIQVYEFKGAPPTKS